MHPDKVIEKLTDELIQLLKLPKAYTPHIIRYAQMLYAAGLDKGRSSEPHHCRKVKQYSRSGQYIKTHDSVRAAARSVKGDQSFITQACKGKYKTAKGYVWKYANPKI